MRRIAIWGAVAAMAVLAANPASAQAVQTPQAQLGCTGAAATIAALSASPASPDSDVTGRSASLCGYAWSAANLLERAFTERPTPAARFNLAAAYANTARRDAAITLYRSAAADGEFTRLVLDKTEPDGRSIVRVNIADEARARLRTLGMVPTLTVAEPMVSLGNADGRANVAAAIAAAHVTDAEAMSRDGLTASAAAPVAVQP